MTINQNRIFLMVRALILEDFKDTIPSIEEINKYAENVRESTGKMCPVNDQEFEDVKNRLQNNILHTIGEAVTLRNGVHKHWYAANSNDGYFWNRYKEYLLQRKNWNNEVVNRLNRTTDEIMDDLGNPQQRDAFQRRGLLLGDVQSGKTATYTAICNKATDAGYKLIIVLAGISESLRRQTQSRLDAEFIGEDTSHTIDKKANLARKTRKIGVGKFDLNSKKSITWLTSVESDFNKNYPKTVGIKLSAIKNTTICVVKKNKTVLNNLHGWLTKDSNLINLPLLLIDDEADNASINTNPDDKSPTAINEAINTILHSFLQATYLGITATPFANIFISSDTDNDEVAKDLFPRDFITVLPYPSNYIGATQIFGNAEEEIDEDADEVINAGKYNSAIIKILNQEQEFFFKFKHKKSLARELKSLPPSLIEAIYYFILVTAITDYRNDKNAHRSMMVNVSRFIKVQNKTAKLIKEFLELLKNDVENYCKKDFDLIAPNVKRLAELYQVWRKYFLPKTANMSWQILFRDYLYDAIKRIQVQAVNLEHGSANLDYNEYKDVGMRVIAVGGNTLSRGLTLEGLCVSYFYRNTKMYDTLLQMGRWFGYRDNYDDLFKIWMAEDAVDWYGYITDAARELKEELVEMKLQNKTPMDFGLKVRQSPGALLITAKNKMRNAKTVTLALSISGRMIESARLKNDPQIVDKNNKLCREFLSTINSLKGIVRESNTHDHEYIWRNVPKKYIVDLVRNYNAHPWSLDYRPSALADFINDDKNKDLDLWDIAIPSGKDNAIKEILDNDTIIVKPELRHFVEDPEMHDMLRVSGRHVRIGVGGCAKIGLSKEKVIELRNKAKEEHKTVTDKTYLIQGRNPIAIIHFLKNIEDNTKDKYSSIIIGIGLGFPGGKEDKVLTYAVNETEFQNLVEFDEEEEADE